MSIWWHLAYLFMYALIFGAGDVYGGRFEAKRWRGHAWRMQRLPVRSEGINYYVVAEIEYDRLQRDVLQLSKIKQDCGIE